jgi:hypothetical protein
VFLGSKSGFAYVLLAFVLGNAVLGITYSYGVALGRDHIVTADGVTRVVINFWANAFNNYFYDLLALQTWFFAL